MLFIIKRFFRNYFWSSKALFYYVPVTCAAQLVFCRMLAERRLFQPPITVRCHLAGCRRWRSGWHQPCVLLTWHSAEQHMSQRWVLMLSGCALPVDRTTFLMGLHCFAGSKEAKLHALLAISWCHTEGNHFQSHLGANITVTLHWVFSDYTSKKFELLSPLWMSGLMALCLKMLIQYWLKARLG